MELSSNLEGDVHPTDGSKRVGKSKWTENVSGDEVEAGSTARLANGSLSIHPFIIGDTKAGRL